MPSKHRSVQVISIMMIAAVLLSACTQSLSEAPVATPTLIPTGLFVSPIASVDNPMALIEEFAKQTAAAQTTIAGGGTPGATLPAGTAITNTPDPALPSATPTINIISTPTNANSTAAVPTAIPGTAVPAGVRPNEYTLRDGEYPYCIARRFNVDPDALLQASGLTSPDIYYAGLKLVIPQSGAFPGSRSLKAHPVSYTVSSGDETIYSIACAFGDVDPNSIASANGISASAKLTVGQVLQIP